MGNLGAAVSLPGYDVKNSADRLKVFSSSFQTLKIYSVTSMSGTVPASGVTTITLTHNLGYYAPYIVIYNGNTTDGVGTSYFMAAPYFGISGLVYGITTRQYATKLEIDIEDYHGDTGDTAYFTVYLFLDDFRSVSESTIGSGATSTSGGEDYGFRVSKSGVDVRDGANSDIILSSSFFNNIVHQKGTSGEFATVSHNLGYVPSYLSYVRPSGASYISYNPLLASVSETDLDPGALLGETAYYVIFKNSIA